MISFFPVSWLLTQQVDACEIELLEVTLTNLRASTNADLKLRKLAGSLAESCSFPKTLTSVLGTIPSVDPPGRPKLEQKVVLTDTGVWNTACPGGMTVFDAAFAQTGAAKAASLYVGCDIARFKFATEQELANANGLVFLSVIVAKHFQDKAVPDTLAIPLLRGLSGLGEAPPAATPSADPWIAARDRVAMIAGKPFEAMPAAEWSTHAGILLPMCESLHVRPVPERAKNRKIEFDTCSEAGRAADHAGAQTPPWFRPINGNNVNWGYYLAGGLAQGDPTLVSFAKDEEIKGTVGYYQQQIKSGALPLP